MIKIFTQDSSASCLTYHRQRSLPRAIVMSTGHKSEIKLCRTLLVGCVKGTSQFRVCALLAQSRMCTDMCTSSDTDTECRHSQKDAFESYTSSPLMCLTPSCFIKLLSPPTSLSPVTKFDIFTHPMHVYSVSCILSSLHNQDVLQSSHSSFFAACIPGAVSSHDLVSGAGRSASGE